MSALTERVRMPTPDPAADQSGMSRRERDAAPQTPASPARSVSAFSFLRGWWEYALALTLGAAVFVTGSGWFVVCLCACFLLACRRTRA